MSEELEEVDVGGSGGEHTGYVAVPGSEGAHQGAQRGLIKYHLGGEPRPPDTVGCTSGSLARPCQRCWRARRVTEADAAHPGAHMASISYTLKPAWMLLQSTSKSADDADSSQIGACTEAAAVHIQEHG